MNLALFDLDNTLLAGDSDFEWAQFLIEQGVLDREIYEARNQEFYDQYKAGTLDIREFLDFQLKPLARHTRDVLDAWHAEFMRRKIMPKPSVTSLSRCASFCFRSTDRNAGSSITLTPGNRCRNAGVISRMIRVTCNAPSSS